MSLFDKVTWSIRNAVWDLPGARALAARCGLRRSDAGSRSFLLRMLPTHSVGAEIGVHKGDLSAVILRIVKPAKFHLIDPWRHEGALAYKDAWYGGQAAGQGEMDARCESVLARFSRERGTGQVIVHRRPSSDASGEFPDDYFDWIYIDGNHLYSFVKADLELYRPKVKVGGLMTGDDYATLGWWKGGVRLAVDEFANGGRVSWVDVRNNQFILVRRS